MDVGVEWHEVVSPFSLARDAHVPYDTADAAAPNQNTSALGPDAIEL